MVSRLREKPPCDVCIKINKGRECEQCIPPVMEENRDAIVIFMLCQDQVIMAPMGGVIAIDYQAIQFTMDLYNIEHRRRCFEKVVFLAREFIACANKGGNV